MYKLKNGGMVSRPAKIGNTFIGSKTDLGQYGYYSIANTKPQDAPDGQMYVDDNTGEYDELKMEYTPTWILQDAPVVSIPTLGTKITKLAFRNRILPEEKRAIYTASESNVDLKIYIDDINVSTFIDLSAQTIIDSVNQLEEFGLLGEGRADIILNTLVIDSELYKGN
jgi:hypothetical protein